MKTVLAFLLPFCVACFAWYLNNRAAPELRYTLSDTIETQQSGGIKPARQIEIANVGNKPAQPVQIKIRKRISGLIVVKDSEADNYRQFDTPTGSVELIYDALRPNGRLRIIVSGESISEADLEIRDQNRLAKPALSGSDSGPVWFVVVIWGGFALYAMLAGKDAAKSWYESNARHRPEQILKRGKPVIISAGIWRSCQETAAYKMGEKQWSDPEEMSSWAVYRLLDSGKPEKVQEDEWLKFSPALRAALIQRIENVAMSAALRCNVVDLLKILDTKRPSSVLQEHWDKLLGTLRELYSSAVVNQAITRWGLNPDRIRKVLTTTKPDAIDESRWEDAQSKLQALYFASLTRDVVFQMHPATFLKSADLTCLDETDSQRLKEFAYRLELSKLPNVTGPGAEKFLSLAKPDFIEQKDYDDLIEVASKIKDLESREAKLRTKELKLVGDEKETSKLKNRVLRQLEIIEAFTGDPGTVDGIEDHEGAFAPRNLANLKLLGDFRKKAAKV